MSKITAAEIAEILRSLEFAGVPSMDRIALQRYIDALENELATLDALFDLQHERMGEAIERWREAHPGNERVRPDLGTVLTWLLASPDTQELAQVRTVLRRLWRTVGPCTCDDAYKGRGRHDPECILHSGFHHLEAEVAQALGDGHQLGLLEVTNG